ncbi:MAG: translation initiation factor IF-2 N-terminal domain-containing protein, partial [Acidimicrobiales bacterium]
MGECRDRLRGSQPRVGLRGWKTPGRTQERREQLAAKIRVYELARELGLSNKEALDLCVSLGIGVKSHSSSIEDAQADRVRRKADADGLRRATQPEEPAAPAKKPTRATIPSERSSAPEVTDGGATPPAPRPRLISSTRTPPHPPAVPEPRPPATADRPVPAAPAAPVRPPATAQPAPSRPAATPQPAPSRPVPASPAASTAPPATADPGARPEQRARPARPPMSQSGRPIP